MSLIVPRAYLSKYEEIKNSDDFRAFSMLLWFDSLPQDWMERIADTHYPALISPRHDADLLDDGTPKKPHYHVLFILPGKKTYAQVQYLVDYVADSTDYPWEVVIERHRMARYLCHLDQPKKHRYPVMDIVSVNGASVSKLLSHNASEDDEYCDELMIDLIGFIHDHHIMYYNQLIDALLGLGEMQLAKYARKGMRDFLKTYLHGLLLEQNELKEKARKRTN